MEFSLRKIPISSGNSRFPIAGRHFPQEIPVRHLPAGVFLRKIPFRNCRTRFSSGNRRLPQENVDFQLPDGFFLRKIAAAGECGVGNAEDLAGVKSAIAASDRMPG
jgi:hypothetical protein